MLKSILKGIWEFCRFVFVPRKRPNDKSLNNVATE